MAELLGDRSWVTDGGLETDLMFNRGIEIPDFAAFPLVTDPAGVEVLTAYYREYAAIAVAAGAGLLLETPTWRANPDWAARLGYDAARLEAANHRAVGLVRSVADQTCPPATLISGNVGPRGDGYLAAGADADEAADYHAPQARAFAAAGVDVVHAMTLSEPTEAIGVVRAARSVGVPVAISFTVETDGRLPDGTTLRDAVLTVDAAEPPDWYGINCAHPLHVSPALDDHAERQDGGWRARVAAFRPNASTLSHAELDEMTELDPGEIALLTRSTDKLRDFLPGLRVLGGCCGTDVTHVAALWGASLNS